MGNCAIIHPADPQPTCPGYTHCLRTQLPLRPLLQHSIQLALLLYMAATAHVTQWYLFMYLPFIRDESFYETSPV